MNSRIAFCVFLSFSMVAQAEEISGGGLSIAFDDLPKLVRERNERVQSAGFTLKASEQRAGSLVRSFAPKFAVQGGIEDYNSDSSGRARQPYWKFDTSVNLYRGGKDSLENDARQADARAAKASFGNEYGQELKEARQVYWKLVATEMLLRDRKTAMDRNDSNLRAAKRRVGAGVATSADAIQFELHKTVLFQEFKRLELLRDTYKNRLSTALALDEHKMISVAQNFPKPSSSTEIPAVKMEDQLEVKVLNERRSFERLKQEQAGRWWRPTIDVYSSYAVPSISNDYGHAVNQWKEFAFGVRVGIDLGEGANALQESRARSHEAASLERQAAHRTREITSADHELRHDLKMLTELIAGSDRDVEKAEHFLKLTESEYGRGAKNGPDLLGAFQKFYEFRDRRTELYQEFHETRAELLSLTLKEVDLE